MILIYLNSRFPQPHEEAFIRTFPGRLGHRNSRYWRGEVEGSVTEVFTNSADIRAAYEAARVLVHEIPGEIPVIPEPEPEPEPAPKKTRAPRKTTTTTRKTTAKK
jgi:hypothetical protein